MDNENIDVGLEDTSDQEVILEENSETDSLETEDDSEQLEDESESTSEDSSEQIDYTESLVVITDHLDMISSRLEYLSASFWIFISVGIAIILYRLFAWFWKDV